MAFVAEREGVEVVRLRGLSRELSPVRDRSPRCVSPRLIRKVRPDVLHTHTAKAGAVGRAAAILAGRRRPRVVVHTFHGHVLRGYFGTAGSLVFRAIETALARVTDQLIAVSPQVRDELVGLGVAPREQVRRHPTGHRARAARRLRRDPAAIRAASASPPTGSWSAGSGA